MHKTYWRDREEEAKRGALGYAVVDASQSMWCMDEDECERTGEQVMQVMVNLVKPPPSEDDVRWRRGRRKERPKPNAFFADDTDAYGLAPLLMAMQFCETGDGSCQVENDVACLPEDVRTQSRSSSLTTIPSTLGDPSLIIPSNRVSTSVWR